MQAVITSYHLDPVSIECNYWLHVLVESFLCELNYSYTITPSLYLKYVSPSLFLKYVSASYS